MTDYRHEWKIELSPLDLPHFTAEIAAGLAAGRTCGGWPVPHSKLVF